MKSNPDLTLCLCVNSLLCKRLGKALPFLSPTTFAFREMVPRNLLAVHADDINQVYMSVNLYDTPGLNISSCSLLAKERIK